jgi:hypothetical protein
LTTIKSKSAWNRENPEDEPRWPVDEKIYTLNFGTTSAAISHGDSCTLIEKTIFYHIPANQIGQIHGIQEISAGSVTLQSKDQEL